MIKKPGKVQLEICKMFGKYFKHKLPSIFIN